MKQKFNTCPTRKHCRLKNFTQMFEFLRHFIADRAKNIVGNGENAENSVFSFFAQCFPIFPPRGSIKDLRLVGKEIRNLKIIKHSARGCT